MVNVSVKKTGTCIQRPKHLLEKDTASTYVLLYHLRCVQLSHDDEIVSKFVSQDYILDHVEAPLCSEVDETLTLLMDTTTHDGQVDVFKPMQLITLNIALMITFAMHATSIHDTLFETLVDYIDRGVEYLGPLGDTSMQLPHLAWMIELFTKNRKAMADFSFKERDPYYYDLVEKALASDQDCFAKAIDAMRDDVHVTKETVMIACRECDNAINMDPIDSTILYKR